MDTKDIQQWFNNQKIEPVQDRRDGKNYHQTDNLFTEIDLLDCIESYHQFQSTQMRDRIKELEELAENFLEYIEWVKNNTNVTQEHLIETEFNMYANAYNSIKTALNNKQK